MKVKDNLTNLFNIIDNNNAESDVFKYVDSELLDKFYINMYGERYVTDIVLNLDIQDLADIIANQYLNKWNQIILQYLDSENILDDYSETVKEINEDIMTNKNVRTDTNRVSAYNDDDFVNKDEVISSDDSDVTNDRNKNIVRTKLKDTDFYIKVNNYLNDFNMYSIMIVDLNEITTLSILN